MSAKILIYEALLLYLKGACEGSSEVSVLRDMLDSYMISMAFDNVVCAVAESLECRKRLLELSSKLGLASVPELRTALRADEERIATFIVSILSSKSDEEAVLRLEGDSAQHFLDVVQGALDRGFMMGQEHNRMALRIIRKLSESCDKLPSSLFIIGVNGRDEHPTFGGGYGDIYRASYNDQRVALKRMRHFLRGSDLRRMRLKFCREALVWKDLHHPHILPFLGIDRDSFPSSLCMVSPWMDHGTVINYLDTHGNANLDKLLYEIAQGLRYLHSRNIVHGDLRGANILIKEDWSACLTDFGLSIFSDATSTMSTNRGGSLYWMAPELLDPDRFGCGFARTPATDVYAFGCVCFELYTGRPPFSNLSEPAALMKVLGGQRPKKPSGPPIMSDMLWQHVTEFWAETPTARPLTEIVVRKMARPQPIPSLDEDAQALYDYNASSDYPNRLSFSKGEIVRIINKQGRWWAAMKPNGRAGIVPSNYMKIVAPVNVPYNPGNQESLDRYGGETLFATSSESYHPVFGTSMSDLAPERDEKRESGASEDMPVQRYIGWVAAAVAPLQEFIDEHIDPREFYCDLEEVAEGENGSVYVATLVSNAVIHKLRLPPLLTARDADELGKGRRVRVAIKLIPLIPGGSQKIMEVQRECMLLRGLWCDHVVGPQALYVDLVEDSLWIRMELMERSLADVIGLVGHGLRLREPQIMARFASDMLQALDFLQKHHIAHRDFRSDNLLLDSKGVLKLTDFSNAVSITPENPLATDVVGLVYWRAPEVDSASYDPLKIDVWAVGATLWEIAEASPPFADTQQSAERWPPLSDPAPYPPSFHDFLRLCSEPAASRPTPAALLETPFVQKPCGRPVIVQLLSHCTTIERTLAVPPDLQHAPSCGSDSPEPTSPPPATASTTEQALLAGDLSPDLHLVNKEHRCRCSICVRELKPNSPS